MKWQRPERCALVFDEPTIGLHPADVAVLLKVFEQLLASGATVIVIEHDLDVIRSADWIVDLGPGGGMPAANWWFRARPKTSKLKRGALPVNTFDFVFCRCIAYKSSRKL